MRYYQLILPFNFKTQTQINLTSPIITNIDASYSPFPKRASTSPCFEEVASLEPLLKFIPPNPYCCTTSTEEQESKLFDASMSPMTPSSGQSVQSIKFDNTKKFLPFPCPKMYKSQLPLSNSLSTKGISSHRLLNPHCSLP